VRPSVAARPLKSACESADAVAVRAKRVGLSPPVREGGLRAVPAANSFAPVIRAIPDNSRLRRCAILDDSRLRRCTTPGDSRFRRCATPDVARPEYTLGARDGRKIEKSSSETLPGPARSRVATAHGAARAKKYERGKAGRACRSSGLLTKVEMPGFEPGSAHRSPTASTCVSLCSFLLARSSARERPIASQPCKSRLRRHGAKRRPARICDARRPASGGADRKTGGKEPRGLYLRSQSEVRVRGYKFPGGLASAPSTSARCHGFTVRVDTCHPH
jgi:hypothetical protein